jgi:hypothetical protein
MPQLFHWKEAMGSAEGFLMKFRSLDPSLKTGEEK